MTTPATKKTRVLVVDDSAFMCRVLKEIINSDPQLEVVGVGKDGRDAVSLAESLHPDVITMDINMPHLDGLQATELIMSSHPRPIVIVSSESREGAASTLKALELGAVDFVPKPSSGIDLDMKAVAEDLTRKLKLAAKVRVIRTATRSKLNPVVSNAPATVGRAAMIASAANPGGKTPLVVIAASTGGPAAVTQVVSAFPADLSAAILLVLHMPGNFTKQFACQLAEISRLPVKEAEPNEVPQAGTIYVCPGSQHMRIGATGKILLDDGPRIDGYRPCANVTLESAAVYGRVMTIGVVLTGMGNDAALGAKSVKNFGGSVIAQDEATSMIFGMPAEAIKACAVDDVLPIQDIGAAIERRLAKLAHLVPAGAR